MAVARAVMSISTAVVVFAKAINLRRVGCRGKVPWFKKITKWLKGVVPHPLALKGADKTFVGKDCASWRGGGFQDQYQHFFVQDLLVALL